ncbi:Pyridoxine/pyridoxamine 5'-phosphate oxidase 1 [Nymphaea thermarum]|nr:Pyridoxine/pyridoxamine 5'-phosphate oxidase 1 [Nymphaea thermarum]
MEQMIVVKFLAALSSNYSTSKAQMLTGSDFSDLDEAFNRLNRLTVTLPPSSNNEEEVVYILPVVEEEAEALEDVEDFSALFVVFKPSTHSRVLAICGPGNNGGDGLVAARHLYHFGYKPFICYPKRTTKALYSGLVTQLESLSIPFLTAEELPLDLSNDFDIIVDAMFGFSFHGAPRPPFDVLIQQLVDLQDVDYGPKMPAIVSIDIPSGWHVEDGDVGGKGIKPDMLVSLTAPKLCAKKFSGRHHFLGGRFVPPTIVQKYMLKLPHYPGTSMCVRIGKPQAVDVSSLRENYLSPVFLEDQVHDDPTIQFVWSLLMYMYMLQFSKWFEDAVAAGLREPNAMALSTADKNGKPYTNYESRKAVEISENSNACLLFFWNDLNRQVRIEGTVQKVPEDESDKYFHSRPRGSQIGAIVSKQSSVIPGRHVLRQAYEELEAKFSDVDIVPRPKHWGGYCLKPTMFEFWQGQQSRLHDSGRALLPGCVKSKVRYSAFPRTPRLGRREPNAPSTTHNITLGPCTVCALTGETSGKVKRGRLPNT